MKRNSGEDFNEKTSLLVADALHKKSSYSGSEQVLDIKDGEIQSSKSASITLKKHIRLPHAIGIMVGAVAGTGIFISPTGVTKQVGSVGGTLIMWTVYGLFNLLLAMCYAELGTALPLAGGDYAYIDYVLGKFPAFLCLWLMVVLIGPCAIGVTARTVAAYLTAGLGLECYMSISMLVSTLVVVTATILNCASVLWSSRMITLFSIGKVLAMGVIVVTGIVNLALGYTKNFEEPFAYGTTDPGKFMLSFLPAFFTFAGWDCVNALVEEMVNPRRDLPIAMAVGVSLVTGVYVLMNVAYFTVLTPLEFIESDAVASLFAERALPSVAFLVPVFIIISSIGSTLNLILACPRWGFAGGRNKALPTIFSYIHINNYLPIPSILFTAVLTIFFCLAVFFDIQELLNITSIIVQIKILFALIALLILKRREPNKPSTITIPFIVVILATLVLTAFTVVPIYQSPIVAGAAFGIFLLGIPLYYIQGYVGSWQCTKRGMDALTKNLQLLLQVVPSGESKAE